MIIDIVLYLTLKGLAAILWWVPAAPPSVISGAFNVWEWTADQLDTVGPLLFVMIRPEVVPTILATAPLLGLLLAAGLLQNFIQWVRFGRAG